ncbi:hypothetical protein [Romboutsia sp.]|uniref:hypothetical protein n=1 Tax=Romboutsia sp. TaxID=1965302 RepID=UPI003F37BB83
MNVKVNIDWDKIKDKVEQYHFQVGVFSENNARAKVSHKKSSLTEIKKLSAKTGTPAYRNIFRSSKGESKTTNAQLFQYEIEKGRNYIVDAFNNPANLSRIMTILRQFSSQSSNLNMQQACQELVRIVRQFIESNPYRMHNAPSTIKQKGQDKWFIDSRQAQMSVRARFMSKETLLAIS